MTIFNTPILSRFLKIIAWAVLLVIGWRPGRVFPKTLKNALWWLRRIPQMGFRFVFAAGFCAQSLCARAYQTHHFIGPVGWFLPIAAAFRSTARGARLCRMMAEQFENDVFHLVVTPEARAARAPIGKPAFTILRWPPMCRFCWPALILRKRALGLTASYILPVILMPTWLKFTLFRHCARGEAGKLRLAQ